ncbi:MAG: hypothetical protein ABH879_05020 [archaeon]
MINPDIIEERPITIGELKEEMKKIKKRDGEFNFREKKTEDYVNMFKTLDKKTADKLKKDIAALDIPRLKENHVVKIIDLMPESVDDLKLILQGYPITINKDNLKKIADVVNSYR